MQNTTKETISSIVEKSEARRMSMMSTMFNKQYELNVSTNGEEWCEGITKEGRIISWERCMVMEATELMESFPWKHWKSLDAKPDIQNAKIELVDIFHFLISLHMEDDYKSSNDIDRIVEDVMGTTSTIRVVNDDAFDISNLDIGSILTDIDYFVYTVNKYSYDNGIIADVYEAFFDICDSLNLSLEDLYRLYIGKNCLNTFRQNHGYKQGTYVKIWDGREDNVVMEEILNTIDITGGDADADTLMMALENRYKTILKD